jgi:hypothetical protein
MHPWWVSLSCNVLATVVEAVGVGMVDVVDAVDPVNTVEMVDPETAMKVSVPITQLKAIQQMHAESTNVCRREETTEMMRAFASSAGSQATSTSITSPTNV